MLGQLVKLATTSMNMGHFWKGVQAMSDDLLAKATTLLEALTLADLNPKNQVLYLDFQARSARDVRFIVNGYQELVRRMAESLEDITARFESAIAGGHREIIEDRDVIAKARVFLAEARAAIPDETQMTPRNKRSKR
jgi:hypothetical protein